MLRRFIKLSALTLAAVATTSAYAETKLLANVFFPPGPRSKRRA